MGLPPAPDPLQQLVPRDDAAALAVALLVLLPFSRAPGVDAAARAEAALAGGGTVFRVVERIEPAIPGLFRPSTRTGWLDPARGLARWSQQAGGRTIAETLIEHDRISRYLPAERAVIVGPSCHAFASGCAEVIDPLSFYRSALARSRARGEAKVTRVGRSAYLLALPVQSLPNAVPVEQVATLDARTFLPLRIEWRERRAGGRERVVSVIVVQSIERVPRAGAPFDAFQLALPAGVRVEQRAAPGRPLRRLGERRLSIAQASRLSPPILWLGPSYQGLRLTGISEVRWNAGEAVRLRYGPLVVWDYDRVIPPELAASRFVPAKSIPLRDGLARFYSTPDGRLVAELEQAGGSVALIAPSFGKVDLFHALQDLRPLR